MTKSPEFFVDRSLGRLRVPGLLRNAGWSLRTLAEVYGVPADEKVHDEEWLHRAGVHDWVVLMKDDRIRYREVERRALTAGNVRSFCLAGGNLSAERMAECLMVREAAIWEACLQPGPFLYVVSTRTIRRADV